MGKPRPHFSFQTTIVQNHSVPQIKHLNLGHQFGMAPPIMGKKLCSIDPRWLFKSSSFKAEWLNLCTNVMCFRN